MLIFILGNNNGNTLLPIKGNEQPNRAFTRQRSNLFRGALLQPQSIGPIRRTKSDEKLKGAYRSQPSKSATGLELLRPIPDAISSTERDDKLNRARTYEPSEPASESELRGRIPGAISPTKGKDKLDGALILRSSKPVAGLKSPTPTVGTSIVKTKGTSEKCSPSPELTHAQGPKRLKLTQPRRVPQINFRTKIPGTSLTSYRRHGKTYHCPPNVEPWTARDRWMLEPGQDVFRQFSFHVPGIDNSVYHYFGEDILSPEQDKVRTDADYSLSVAEPHRSRQ